MSEQQADVPAVPGVTREPLVMPQDEFEMVKKGAKILGSINARLYRTMAAARIEMLQNGPHSLLAANLPAKMGGSLCSQTLSMPTAITGQDGAVIKQTTKIAVFRCPKRKRVRG